MEMVRAEKMFADKNDLKVIRRKFEDSRKEIKDTGVFSSNKIMIRATNDDRFLEVKVSHVLEYLGTLDEDKQKKLSSVFWESIEHAKKHRIWEFWECFVCKQRYTESEEFKFHLMSVHIGTLIQTSDLAFPQKIHPDLEKEIANVSYMWDPIDAVKVFDDLSGSDLGKIMEWPLADDTERRNKLHEVRIELEFLLWLGCLAHVHLGKAIWIGIQNMDPQFVEKVSNLYTINRTLLPLRFSTAESLTVVLRFLQSLSTSSGIVYLPTDEISTDAGLAEEIMFNNNFSCFLLDKKSVIKAVTLRDNNCENDPVSDDTLLPRWCSDCFTVDEMFDSLDKRLLEARKFWRTIENLLEKLHEEKLDFIWWFDEYGAAKYCIAQQRNSGKSYRSILQERLTAANDRVINLILNEASSLDLSQTEDSRIEMIINKELVYLEHELFVRDATLMCIMTYMERFGRHDYRFILLGILKNSMYYLQICKSKADASMNALLAEEATAASDARKDKSQMQAKQKKKKCYRRLKSQKATAYKLNPEDENVDNSFNDAQPGSKERGNKLIPDESVDKSLDNDQWEHEMQSLTSSCEHPPLPEKKTRNQSVVKSNHEQLSEMIRNKLEFERNQKKNSSSEDKKGGVPYNCAQLDSEEKTASERSLITLESPDKIKQVAGICSNTDGPVPSAAESPSRSHTFGTGLKPGVIIQETGPNKETGLKNDADERSGFNAIIQSLLHIRRFRDELTRISPLPHEEIVECELLSMFSFLKKETLDDPCDVLLNILMFFHRLSEPADLRDSFARFISCNACFGHTLFGLHIVEGSTCSNCGVVSREKRYNLCYYEVDGKAIRFMKARDGHKSFVELLKLIETNSQYSCSRKTGGCGRINSSWIAFSSLPHVFVVAFMMETICESVEEATVILEAVDTDIDFPFEHRGSDPLKRYDLISMVCFDQQQCYCSFGYNQESKIWMLFGGADVGDWGSVWSFCIEGFLQPRLLFFEALP